jgi:hypothetical protein
VPEEIKQDGDSVGDGDSWPSVKYAYDFVIPSYQLLVSRFEAADTRLTALLTFISTLTLAVPLFAKSARPSVSFASPVFLFGVAIFVLAAILGIVGRVSGGLILPDPMIIYEKSLGDSEWEFKRDQLYYAGVNFETNRDAVKRKSDMSIALTIGILIEVIAFVVWFTTATAA